MALRTGPEWMVGRMINCCVDCSLRNYDCHSRCEEYLRQRAEHEEERAAYQAIRKQEGILSSYVKTARRRTARRKNRMKGG